MEMGERTLFPHLHSPAIHIEAACESSARATQNDTAGVLGLAVSIDVVENP